MRALKGVNLNLLRVFEMVYRHGSMSLAARDLHLTQPGVSQHIKTLEEELGMKLFSRMNQRILPTSEGRALYRECELSLNRMENLLAQLKSSKGDLSGDIYLGMPIEFGNIHVLPLLCEFNRKYPNVHFHITYDFASVMNQRLLDGQLDFAFVDEYKFDRRISTAPVMEETLELCIHKNALSGLGKIKEDMKLFEKLRFVEYQAEPTLLYRWFRHHLGVQKPRLILQAHVMDVQGVTRLIKGGLGAGIIPGYVLEALLKQGVPLQKFKGSGTPLTNSISLALLKDREQSPAAESLRTFLKQKLG
jgi:DNA-binding transcriptional LysR family regulator